ncbi:MAG: hypothetical protein JWN31_927 [Frankiales bacterium]|nr:hypothetical protein [Frankiales bacterium]
MKRLRARMYALASHRAWWLLFVAAAALFAYLLASVHGRLSVVVTLPVVVFAFLLVNARSHWKRDEARERATGQRRGPFD